MMLAYGALPAALLATSVGLSIAYYRLRASHTSMKLDKECYLEVIEGSNDALFVINFVNGRIHQANQQAADLLGHTPEQLQRLTIFDLHPQELLGLSAQRIADAWEEHGLIYEDLPLLHRSGEVIPVECSTRVTSFQGRPAIILFARDIRDRLKLQQQVEQQQSVVRQQSQELLSSIRYAQRIQRAVLPDATELQELISESFILFRPRDIVSGDLYWFAQHDRHTVVIAADCTGHGVPGALLSLIAATTFAELVAEKGITDPASILNGACAGMVRKMNHRDDEPEQHDGMNASVVSLDRETLQLEYAGAHAPLYIVRNGELIEHKGDRMSVGHREGVLRPFQKVQLQLQPGDRLFLFSDGLQDQFGGPQGRKLRSTGVKEWLLDTAQLSIDDQYQALSDRFRQWKGDQEQIDDVLLIGLQA